MGGSKFVMPVARLNFVRQRAGVEGGSESFISTPKLRKIAFGSGHFGASSTFGF